LREVVEPVRHDKNEQRMDIFVPRDPSSQDEYQQLLPGLQHLFGFLAVRRSSCLNLIIIDSISFDPSG